MCVLCVLQIRLRVSGERKIKVVDV
jgi:hypothetical protein